MERFVAGTLPKLLHLLYDAALEPAQWHAFIEALSEPFGGANGVLHAFDRQHELQSNVLAFGYHPDYIASFLAHYRDLNPYPRNAGRMPVGKVMSASDVIGREEIEKSEFFNDWMRPQYITADHFGVRLCDDGATYVTLGVAPPDALLARHRDRYEQQFTLLVPHLTRALQINRLTAAARASEQLTDAILDAWSASVLVLDRAGRLIRFNRRAATLLEAGVLRYSRDRGLRASLTEEAAALEAAIATAFAFGARGAAGPVRLTGPSDGTVHLAWIVPLDASALVAGSSVPDYAAQTGLSRNTVRNQLAAVFAKTGTSRQSELLALIVRTLGRHFGGEA